MKVSKTLRVLLGSLILVIGAGVIWWVVGYALGKAVLSETGGGAGFRAAYGFRDSGVIQLFFLALLSVVVRLVGGDAAGRWLRLAVLAGFAALLTGGLRAEGLSAALFVFAVAAVAEAHAAEALWVALVAGAVVAFASTLGTELSLGPKLIVTALRDLFLYVPLLLGPELLDRTLWKKLD